MVIDKIYNAYEKMVITALLWASRKIIIIELHKVRDAAFKMKCYASCQLLSEALAEEKSIKQYFRDTPRGLITPSALYVLWGHVLDLKAQCKKLLEK